MLNAITLINQHFYFSLSLLSSGVLIGVFATSIMILILKSQLQHTQAQNKASQEQRVFLQEQVGLLQEQAGSLQEQLQQLQTKNIHLESSCQTLQQTLQQKEINMAKLHVQQQERERAQQQQALTVKQHKQQMSQEFEYLAQKVFNSNGIQQSKQQEQSLKHLLMPFQDQITHFGKQVQQFQHTQISSHASLNHELQNLKTLNKGINQEAKNLTRALKGDKKLTGTWGEIQLERSLQAAGLQSKIHYFREMNFQTHDGQNRRPDFVINLPNDKHIIIDSKMSLIAFEAAMSAHDVKTQTAALNQHIKALKKHINDLQQKDYTSLIGLHSPDFVLMYLAAEPALTEALKHDSQLYDYAANKNILLVSQTTLMPIMKTIANIWLRDKSQKQAFELSEKAGDIYQQICTLAERLQRLGKSLQTVGNNYNDTVTALAGKQGLHGKVARFGELAKGSQFPHSTKLQQDIDIHRLAPLLED